MITWSDSLNGLEELKQLNYDGWLGNGEGKSIRIKELEWLRTTLDENFPKSLPPPYIYPTVEGNVRAEWSIKNYEINLEINLVNHCAEWYHVNMVTDEDENSTFDLDDNDSCLKLISKIKLISETL